MLMRKLILLNTAILAIVAMILVGSSLSLINKIVKDETMESYSRTMDVGYKQISELFTSAERLLLDLCTDKTFQKAVKDSNFEVAYYDNAKNLLIMDNLLKEFNGQSSYLTTGFYPFLNERVYRYHYVAGLWVPSAELLTQPWLMETIKSDGEFIWNIVEQEQGQTLRISKFMYDIEEMNKVLGVAYVDIKIEPIENILYFSILSGKGTGYLIDDKDNIILPTNSQDVLPQELLASIGDYSGIDGSNILFARNFTDIHWKIGGVIANNVMLEKSKDINRNIIIIGIILGILSIILTTVITRKVIKPIDSLAFQMKNEEEDQLPKPLPVPKKQGEITTLYNSFNHMIERIHELIKGMNTAKRKEKEAELMALQAQINPHFLYNTLDSVYWMAMKYGAADIQSMVLSLSKMLRFSLKVNENIIPVKNELDQVKNYIQIMSMRYPNTLQVEYNIDESILDCFMIRLVLQPLVENGIIHGFPNHSSLEDHGNIIITGQLLDNKLFFEVRNDGVKANLEKINQLLQLDDEQKSKHYGVRNVNSRLIKQYGTGLIYRQEEKWVVVQFFIPLD